jgi:hypothetical protein
MTSPAIARAMTILLSMQPVYYTFVLRRRDRGWLRRSDGTWIIPIPLGFSLGFFQPPGFLQGHLGYCVDVLVNAYAST